MAAKTKGMNKIKQVFELHLHGISNRKISQELGINKETVNRYINRGLAGSVGLEELLELENPVLEHRLTGGRPAYADERFEQFKEQLCHLEEEMKRKHVTLKLLWDEYIANHPGGYSLTQFRFHYNQHSKAQVASTVLRDTYVGGEKLFIDFAGDTLGYIDLETGELIKVQVFVAFLPATDYGYALGVASQKSEDFLYAISCCFKALGGVPKIIVPDNLKSAVTKTDRYEPEINRVFEDFCNHYHCVVIPARPRHPKDKSMVEGLVRLVYSRVYAELRNQTFYCLDELNRAVAQKMQAHNQKRMQQHPYSRQEQFLALEKPALRPLPPTEFQIQSYAKLKVGVNGCIYLGRDKHYYSVPYAHIGMEISVIYHRTLVKIYCQGECVATHTRDTALGKYTLVREHLASHAAAYRDRSPAYYIDQARKATDELGQVIQYMFATATVPVETFYRGCQGLLHLHKTTDPMLFHKACKAALHYQRYRYAFINQLIQTQCKGLDDLLVRRSGGLSTCHPQQYQGERAI